MTTKILAPTPEGVLLYRDQQGIAHIEAKDKLGAFWGMGYCHALDRGLQMVLMRILGQGRACECLVSSDEMLAVDKFFHRMNWANNMQIAFQAISAEVMMNLCAYCDGVNARLTRKPPFELKLVRHKPEPWRPEDTILLSRMTSYLTLAQSQAEIERLLVEMVQAGISNTHLEAIFPGNLKGLDRELISRVTLTERIVPEALKWCSPVPRMMASNNWVISGNKSASGYAMMANDPHLELNRLPNVWYMQAIELPQAYWLVANMPGLPAALVGRNEHLAWGVTYAFMDAVDSWIEHCKDGCYRRGEDEWIPFHTRTETIKCKKGSDVTVTFYENDHGVLDGDPSLEGYYLATRWAPANAGGCSLMAADEIWQATTVQQGMKAVGKIESAWNWVLADDQGNIGYQMSGRMPRRSPGVKGFVPLPGWLPEYDWQGWVNVDDLPASLNPEQGFIVTANQDLNALGKTNPINMPMGDYRARRITQRLAASNNITTDDIAAMHMDVYSIQAAEFMQVLRPQLPDSETGKILTTWDCRYDTDSRGALAFELFYRALYIELFAPEMGTEVLDHLIDTTCVFIDFYQSFDRLLMAEGSPWHGERTRDDLFRAAAARLPDVLPGTWGQKNRITLTNIFFNGRMPRFLGFDRGPYALPGGRATPHQGQIYQSAGRTTSFAPSLRLIADLGEKMLSICMTGGPSDRRFSRWYNSGTPDWQAGRYNTLTPRPDE